jgi:hypothetical protein
MSEYTTWNDQTAAVAAWFDNDNTRGQDALNVATRKADGDTTRLARFLEAYVAGARPRLCVPGVDWGRLATARRYGYADDPSLVVYPGMGP